MCVCVCVCVCTRAYVFVRKIVRDRERYIMQIRLHAFGVCLYQRGIQRINMVVVAAAAAAAAAAVVCT